MKKLFEIGCVALQFLLGLVGRRMAKSPMLHENAYLFLGDAAVLADNLSKLTKDEKWKKTAADNREWIKKAKIHPYVRRDAQLP